MANGKQVLCLIVVMGLFANFESGSVEALMERDNTPPKGSSPSPQLIHKSQLLKATFSKAFSNSTVSKRLAPGGPDHIHH
ncbi:hypothetical protein VNO78_13806 [Psophocarpus tetragonolobus]|uniref:Uncharacterized protein n=1 Tax=Psophocarpus tetragonolobus TaxID=3891 RepID=A0AAN9XQQ3_PSOTE